MSKSLVSGAVAAVVLAAFALAGGRQQSPSPRVEHGPKYTKEGKLLRPDDYRTWVFAGADLGIEYGRAAYRDEQKDATGSDKKVGDFHNVYINTEAYDHYARTGEFPDRTVLVLDVYKAAQKEPRQIVRQGHYEAEQLQVEVAVKDRARPDGSQTVWAYYSFPRMANRREEFAATATSHRDGECYQCHLQHADVDNVWVQFYPTLRRLRQAPR
jgi:hypothetical protein